jgi:hypothetical protein
MSNINDCLQSQPNDISWPSQQEMNNQSYQAEGLSQLKDLYIYCLNLLANLSANNAFARKEILSAKGM